MKKLIIYSLLIGLFISSCTTEDSSIKTDDLATQEIINITTRDIDNVIKQAVGDATLSELSAHAHQPCSQVIEPTTFCSTTHVTDQSIYLAASGSRPECTDMLVTYDITICFDPLTGQFTIDIFNLSAFPGSCPAFITWFLGLPNASKNDAIDKWEYDVSVIIELNQAQAIAQGLPINCPNTFATFNYSNETCYSRCLILLPKFPWFQVTETLCGNECCVRTRRACKGISGAVLFGEASFETQGDSCDGEPTTCGHNSIPLTKFCGTSCGPK